MVLLNPSVPISAKFQLLVKICKQSNANRITKTCQNYVEEGGTIVFSPTTGVCYSINLHFLNEVDADKDKMIATSAGQIAALTLELNIESNYVSHLATLFQKSFRHIFLNPYYGRKKLAYSRNSTDLAIIFREIVHEKWDNLRRRCALEYQ